MCAVRGRGITALRAHCARIIAQKSMHDLVLSPNLVRQSSLCKNICKHPVAFQVDSESFDGQSFNNQSKTLFLKGNCVVKVSLLKPIYLKLFLNMKWVAIILENMNVSDGKFYGKFHNSPLFYEHLFQGPTPVKGFSHAMRSRSLR